MREHDLLRSRSRLRKIVREPWSGAVATQCLVLERSRLRNDSLGGTCLMAVSKIRVLQVNKLYKPWVGGIEQVVADFSEGLIELGADVTVLCAQPRGYGVVEVVDRVEVVRCTSLGMLLGMPLSPSFPFVLRSLAGGYDILHFHMPFPLAAAGNWFVRRGTSRPRILVHYHSDIVRQKRWEWAYGPSLKSLMRTADRIIITSPALSQSKYVSPHLGKVVVIPLPVDMTKHTEPDRHMVGLLRERFGLRGTRPVILFVGRFVYYKGLEYLIEAMAEVDATLLLVGTGPLEARLRRLAQRVSDRVHFLGSLSDAEVAACYELANLFVLPSVEASEAFGVVQVEAMAHGLPVVNTQLPTGVPWVSQHGVTGLTVPPRDPRALAAAINLILRSPDMAEEFSRNARRRAQEFRREKILHQLYSLYMDLL